MRYSVLVARIFFNDLSGTYEGNYVCVICYLKYRIEVNKNVSRGESTIVFVLCVIFVLSSFFHISEEILFVLLSIGL